MARRRYTADSTGGEPIEFEIDGTDIHGQPFGPEVFRCLPKVQGSEYAEMIAAIDRSQQMAVPKILDFIQAVVIEDDAQRFHDLTHSKTRIIEADLLGEIFMGLVEDYSNRPTATPPLSPVGQSPIGVTSAVGVSGQAVPTPPPFHLPTT